MNYRFVFCVVAATNFFIFLSCKENTLPASIVMMRGNVAITTKSVPQPQPAKLGQLLQPGDTIHTGDQSGLVLSVPATGTIIEVQSKAVYHLTTLRKDKMEGFSEKGSIWVKTEKRSGSGEHYFKLMTPTMVAAVRGTTFYVFTIEDMEGVCHCEGDVEVSRSRSGYKAEDHTDTLLISKGDKSVLLTAEDLKSIGLKHHHSIFDKSPVGPKNELTPAEYKVFVAFLRKKLESVKSH